MMVMMMMMMMMLMKVHSFGGAHHKAGHVGVGREVEVDVHAVR
jgi:hypothetical protein